MVSRLNQLPVPPRNTSLTVRELARKKAFDGLIKELKRLEPGITSGETARKQAVQAIEKYLKDQPYGDRDKNLTIIAAALGKALGRNVGASTLYRWIREEKDPQAAEDRRADRRESVKVEPLQAFRDAVGVYLRACPGDADGILAVIKDAAIPREKICAALKGLCP